jgi:hypothetical protein
LDPEPDILPEAPDSAARPAVPDPTDLAMRLLEQLAESPLVLASVRVGARRSLKQLRSVEVSAVVQDALLGDGEPHDDAWAED